MMETARLIFAGSAQAVLSLLREFEELYSRSPWMNVQTIIVCSSSSKEDSDRLCLLLGSTRRAYYSPVLPFTELRTNASLEILEYEDISSSYLNLGLAPIIILTDGSSDPSALKVLEGRLPPMRVANVGNFADIETSRQLDARLLEHGIVLR